jgi:ABC-type dipeptide/oligopeptide/nickel transport system permease component
LRERLPATLKLVALAFAIAWLAALLIALALTALRCGRAARWLRTAITAAASTLLAMPVGAVAVAALLLAPTRWLSPSPYSLLPAGLPWLPAAVLAIGLAPAIYFPAVNELAAVMPRPFILATQARGISRLRILLRHALPNTFDLLIPLGSITATQLVLEAVIVETLLAWPGIGQLSMTAAAQRDIPLIAALVLMSSILVITANAASDLLQLWTNPKLRHA